MDSHIAKEMISVIRTERERLADQLRGLAQEDQDAAGDTWLFTVKPFINEMCLIILVALRHHVERQLVFLAARANAGPTITPKQYRQKVKDQRKLLKNEDKKRNGGWKNLSAALDLASIAEWEKSMKTLQLLANCLKHEPWQEPEERLLKHLKLPSANQLVPPVVGYMPLPESSAFERGLAASLNLPNDADYCMIAERFVDLADQFLEDVRHHNTNLAQVSGAISLTEFAW